ncbi:dipeptidase A [Lactobacillus selangorensis]|uniref:Dipeptidase n=1 Tax=Lactobacillus selangorensis TaxID=81857 RepID=A0A0R2FNE2_9LACO|nr:C69 family dipeptidase [Lactobacillus selangorensis]KRN29678.1 dipeptidase A [Lactobacillus selangorensis]KRN33793.1 dipeptidase A [Lactobacillus selangorensis]
MKIESACTSILVGKKASLDGSTMIARNDDTFAALSPHRFYMHPAVHGRKGATLKSYLNGFEAPLPEDGYRYNAVPNVDYKKYGYYDESGINEKNVAMSATESTYGNERALSVDPLVKDGLDEDCMPTMVLPYIDSARDGVTRLGKLIKKYGSPAGNSVLFSDKDEVWYMEIVSGHQWVAQRIPDDAYAIAANQVSIQQVDFNDPDNFMYADGIQEFVEKYHLNTDQEGWNFRHIFGTSNEKDRHYNTPRVWYGQHYFNPEIEQDPESSELPFICHTSHKISVEDIEYVLGSHYNETKYDPMGHADDADKYRYRPIGLNRTQNSHVLQLRNDTPEANSAVMWLCFGYPEFAPYLPFYTNATDTDPTYSETPLNLEWGGDSAYWMYKTLSMLVESHYSKFVQEDTDFLTESKRIMRKHILDTDAHAQELAPEEVTAYLTDQNHAIVKEMRGRSEKLMAHLVEEGIDLSKFTFNMDRNL